MSFDANLKRYFPFVVCALLALAAYLQASGIGELVASHIADAPPTDGSPTLTVPRLSDERPSGAPILSRNPFDSVTGPLDGSEAPTPSVPQTKEGPTDSTQPSLEDPSCDFGRVVLIADSDDPEWSFAAIEHQGSSKLRRVGDEVQGHKLEAMSWDRVWLKSATARCQMKMGDKSQAAPAPKPAPRSRPAPRRRGLAGRSDKLPDELAKGIQKVSDTEFNVERSVVDEILEQQAVLMRRTRVRPVKSGDKTTGIELSRINAGSALDHLGIKNGDQIQNINGFDLSDPQKALEAYGRLRSANRLTVQVLRGNSPVTIEFNIK